MSDVTAKQLRTRSKRSNFPERGDVLALVNLFRQISGPRANQSMENAMYSVAHRTASMLLNALDELRDADDEVNRLTLKLTPIAGDVEALANAAADSVAANHNTEFLGSLGPFMVVRDAND